MRNKSQKYLETFFEEKELESEIFKIKAENGFVYYISNEKVIEIILNETSRVEKVDISNWIKKLDFENRDINSYLKYLAKGYIATQYQVNIIN